MAKDCAHCKFKTSNLTLFQRKCFKDCQKNPLNASKASAKGWAVRREGGRVRYIWKATHATYWLTSDLDQRPVTLWRTLRWREDRRHVSTVCMHRFLHAVHCVYQRVQTIDLSSSCVQAWTLCVCVCAVCACVCTGVSIIKGDIHRQRTAWGRTGNFVDKIFAWCSVHQLVGCVGSGHRWVMMNRLMPDKLSYVALTSLKNNLKSHEAPHKPTVRSIYRYW